MIIQLRTMPLPKKIWILIDSSNSNPNSSNYLWWFETKKIAEDFIKHHNTIKHHSDLEGPFPYYLNEKMR